jgi:hypothetical protein
MLVSALALCAPALAQDRQPTGNELMTTTPATPQAKTKSAQKTAPQDTTATTATEAPTTAAQNAPIAGAPVADTVVPTETAAAPAPQTTPANPAMPAETAAAPVPQATPADPAAQPAPAEVAAAPAAPTPAEPAVTGATQIAQVVNTEFPTYDKNADTNLDKTEFSAWMVALKTASDPATKAGDPATVKWIDGAFASADADKSTMVSKVELTAYLSQGAE